MQEYYSQGRMVYDLEKRTGDFGKNTIYFCSKIPSSPINNPIISQLIKSSTSIGANYCEADDAESKPDFIHKLSICKKEAYETKHWLQMISVAFPKCKKDSEILFKEAGELNLIFNAIIRSTKKNLQDPKIT